MQRMTTRDHALDAEVGHSIDSYLKYRKRTRTELAAYLGIGAEYLRDKIKGRRPWYFHEVARAAQLLDVPIDELVGGTQNLKQLILGAPLTLDQQVA